ncbi:unnamed protein product [Hydatigera taeniaeformis]|uniref:Uncharacterized protein n=1 Tax=Hydatigena taeniaeformis TaxID=6205 RepID=A0A0R3XCS0_HYDTA|nr:unnamed protein product [Hydatigera taeniaeformis]
MGGYVGASNDRSRGKQATASLLPPTVSSIAIEQPPSHSIRVLSTVSTFRFNTLPRCSTASRAEVAATRLLSAPSAAAGCYIDSISSGYPNLSLTSPLSCLSFSDLLSNLRHSRHSQS